MAVMFGNIRDYFLQKKWYDQPEKGSLKGVSNLSGTKRTGGSRDSHR